MNLFYVIYLLQQPHINKTYPIRIRICIDVPEVEEYKT